MILKNMLYVRMNVWTRWLNSSSPGLKLLKTAIWEDSSAVPLAPSHADCDLALGLERHLVLVVHSLHESVERDTGNHTQTKHYRHVLEMDLFTEYMYIYRERSWLNKEWLHLKHVQEKVCKFFNCSTGQHGMINKMIKITLRRKIKWVQ